MDGKEISQAVIRRLPIYYRYLNDLVDEGIERISSNDLSKLMHVTASQIRQDLNNFGEFGQQGYGYNVPYLYTEIGKILGLEQDHRLVIVGAGHLGIALANYVSFEEIGFHLQGIFDVKAELRGNLVRGIPIRMMDELGDFLAQHAIDIAVLTVPRGEAINAAKIVVDGGVTAIWNFAQIDLHVPRQVVVENVHLSDSLMQLSYQIKQHQSQ